MAFLGLRDVGCHRSQQGAEVARAVAHVAHGGVGADLVAIGAQVCTVVLVCADDSRAVAQTMHRIPFVEHELSRARCVELRQCEAVRVECRLAVATDDGALVWKTEAVRLVPTVHIAPSRELLACREDLVPLA